MLPLPHLLLAAAASAAPLHDAVIVLGAGAPLEGWANPWLTSRVCAAVKRAAGKPLLLSGGFTAGHVSESSMMRLAALAYGADPKALHEEDASVDTAENAALSTEIARKRGWKRVAVVSEADHLQRAVPLFEKAGEGFYRAVEAMPVAKDDCLEPVARAPLTADLLVVELSETGLMELVKLAAARHRSGAARRIWLVAPERAPASGPMSITERGRVLAVALGVPWDDVWISSGRRNGQIPGAVEIKDTPWLKIAAPRVAVVAGEPDRSLWQQRLKGASVSFLP